MSILSGSLAVDRGSCSESKRARRAVGVCEGSYAVTKNMSIARYFVYELMEREVSSTPCLISIPHIHTRPT